MSPLRRLATSALVAVVAVVLHSSDAMSGPDSTTYTWVGPSDGANWFSSGSTLQSGNWNPSGGTLGPGDDLSFDQFAGGSLRPNQNGNAQVRNISNNGFYVLGSTENSTLTIWGSIEPSDGTLSITNPVEFVSGASVVTYDPVMLSVLSGSGNFQVSVRAELGIADASSYSGTMTISPFQLNSRPVSNDDGTGFPSFGGSIINNGGAFRGSTIVGSYTQTSGTGNFRSVDSVNQTGGTIVLQPGANTVGSLTGSGDATIDLPTSGTLTIGNASSTTYAGSIGGGGMLGKVGAGTLTLAGANTYSGVTQIAGGVLALSGSGSIGTGGLDLGTNGIFDLAALAAGTATLPATGNLSGAGTLTGHGKTLAVLGSFLPGNSPGTVTLGSGLTLDLSSSGTSIFQITSPLYTAGSFDLVNGTGSVAFGGVLQLDFSGGAYAVGTDVLRIFANTGGRLGDFSSVVFTGLGDGQSATFNAATGFVSVVSAVPEPSTDGMALAGIACGGYSMWRRRRA